MKITKVSQFTGIERTVDLDITEEQYNAWMSGQLIQNAMPNLTPDEREFLISGVTKEEWAEALGEEDEEPIEGDYFNSDPSYE